MKIWIVSDGACEEERIVAVYSNADLAETHIAAIGGWVEEQEVSSVLVPGALDPVKRLVKIEEDERCRREGEAARAAFLLYHGINTTPADR